MTFLNGQPIEPTGGTTSPVAPPVASQDSQAVGRIAGIIALIAGVAFPPAGIVIGAIALGQARAGGYRNGLAKAGLVIGIVLTVLGVVAVVALIILVPQWVQGIVELCEEQGVVVETPNSYECTVG